MCGIIGYTGGGSCAEKLLSGLRVNICDFAAVFVNIKTNPVFFICNGHRCKLFLRGCKILINVIDRLRRACSYLCFGIGFRFSFCFCSENVNRKERNDST